MMRRTRRSTWALSSPIPTFSSASIYHQAGWLWFCGLRRRFAHYHSRDSERIFQAILDAISSHTDTLGVILLGTHAQAVELRLKLENPLNFYYLGRVFEWP